MVKERGKKEGDIQTGKNKIEVTLVLIAVGTKCEGNPCGVSTCATGSRYR